ncbi:unnamed protein product [Allacma fusca]|uniref:Uncharacterized protein n=1 Tax=Allacma fusca TaxID=39272 RepID=A0A8J2PBK4_9HEXA|nr:unnamed protein product [Allacma fusca]
MCLTYEAQGTDSFLNSYGNCWFTRKQITSRERQISMRNLVGKEVYMEVFGMETRKSPPTPELTSPL